MMDVRSPNPKRAAALLIVLATLVLITTASVAIARIAATAKMSRDFDRRLCRADDLVLAVEAPIQQWLARRSQSIVLPPHNQYPAVMVLHEAIAIEHGDSLHVRITAFDQCGMAPIDAIRAGAPIRLGVPQEILSVLDAQALGAPEAPGLDQLVLRDNTSDVDVFPISDDAGVAIGGLIATHNPGLINVNTAPIELIETAMRTSGGGAASIDQIVQARSERRLAPAPALAIRSARSADHQQPLTLTSISPVWSFRIDVYAGPLRRSWWAIYRHHQSQWECIQRLAIPQ